MNKALLFTSFILLAGFMSCKKDASQFQGMVRYIDSTGAYYPAPGATITFHEKDSSKAIVYTGSTDAEGIYNMTGIADGQWVVKATLMVDSTLTYIGISNKLECKGQDFIAAPIDMVEL